MRRGVARVDRVLERLVDVLPADDDHGIDPVVLEQARARGARDVVASVFEGLDLHDPLRRPPQGLQLREQLRELLRRLDEQPGELERLLRRRLDAVEAEQLRRVRDVVDREGERDQVVTVEGGLEEGVRHRDQLRDDTVGLVLELLDVVLRRARRPLPEALVDCAHDCERRLACRRDLRVQLAAAATETDPHQKIASTGNHTSAAMAAAAGIVSTQATTMLPATPQRTAESRFVAPEPITAPETTWVVESGYPAFVDA